MAIFDDAQQHWRDCRMVVTSRPIGTEHLRNTADFAWSSIEPFDAGAIENFIEHSVDGLFERDPAVPRSSEAAHQVDALRRAIVQLPSVQRLAQNPVMLTCLCVVHWNEGQLPNGRARVYRAVIQWLLRAHEELRSARGFTTRFAQRAFGRLALAMMAADGGKQVTIDLQTAAGELDAVVARQFPGRDTAERLALARDWLRYEWLDSGIVEELAGGRVRFWHLTFQEFLAGWELAWQTDDPETGWWPQVRAHLEDPQWRETLDVLPGCLFDEGGESRVDTLLQRGLDLPRSEDESALAHDARVAGLVGRLLLPMRGFDYEPQPPVTATYDGALDRAMAIFTREGAAEVAWPERIAAATALGKSIRQIRYMMKTGSLPARKDDGRWWIAAADLPLTDAQREAMAQRAGAARAALDQALEPTTKAATGDAKRKIFSVTDYRAFQAGHEVYATLLEELPDDDACRALFDALAALTRACHAFHPAEKVVHLWYNLAQNLRVSIRNDNPVTNRNDNVGFRVAVSPANTRMRTTTT